jgi:hypothetical protein
MPAARCVGVVVPAFAAVRGGGEPPTSFARYAREACLRVFCQQRPLDRRRLQLIRRGHEALVLRDQRSERGE